MINSPEGNSFNNAGGLASQIVPIYEYYAERFRKRIARTAYVQNRSVLLRWKRPDWTYHAKGIWLREHPDEGGLPYLTMIGSSNYGERACHHTGTRNFIRFQGGRDTELNAVVATVDRELQVEFAKEWNHLAAFSYEMTELEEKPPIKPHTPILAWFTQALM